MTEQVIWLVKSLESLLKFFRRILKQFQYTVILICVLVKYSPKREQILGEIKDNIDGEFNTDTFSTKSSCPSSLDKLCVIRWTVRGACFEKIILNYKYLMQLWDICLKEPLSYEVKARIIGCQNQMSTFSFFFGICLGKRIFMITDNLSKTLQNKEMSAINSKKYAELTVKTLKNMRFEDEFKEFYKEVMSKDLPIDKSKIGRKRK